MRFRAEQLQAKYPSVVYLSGRRGSLAQAQAMAVNHLADPEHYLVQTYRHGQVFRDAIARMPRSNQDSRYDVSLVIHGLLVSQPHLLQWQHRDGTCVDLQPMEEAGEPTPTGRQVQAWIRTCPDTVTFLTREGNLPRWHWQVRKADRSEDV